MNRRELAIQILKTKFKKKAMSYQCYDHKLH